LAGNAPAAILDSYYGFTAAEINRWLQDYRQTLPLALM